MVSVYQEYSVANEVGTVIVGMVIDGKVDNGVIEGSVIDCGGEGDGPESNEVQS